MRFGDLNELEKIQYIKDGFVLLLEQLALDKYKLKEYLKLEKPKTIVAAVDKNVSEEKNKQLQQKAEAENKKNEEEFKKKEDLHDKILETISKLEKNKYCTCGTCFNLDITNGIIPSELEVLVDIARTEAAERNY